MEVLLTRIVICLFFLFFLGNFCRARNGEAVGGTECIDGPFHKERASPEGLDYVDCLPWKESTCCTADFTAELKRNNVEVLYNFTWNHCGNLSQECERYTKNEECFWQCEPTLIKWHQGKGAVLHVPVCASYCNQWFEACKNDKTCVRSWFDYNYTSNVYTCPIGAQCRSFSEVYKNGKGLCDTMWGNSFKYEEDKDNCMVMWFSGENPNVNVKPIVSSASKVILSPLIVATWMTMINVLIG